MGIQIINNTFKNLTIEQRLVETLGIHSISKIISELMILGFEYASKYPLSLNLESTRGFSYLSPLLRKRQYLKNDFLNIDFYSHKKENLTNTISNRAYIKFFKLINSYKKTNPLASSLHIMATTGARASWDKIRQLIGFRGYLSNARGFLYEIPVMQSFNRGLNIYEYFLSSYGARKGVIDTALKTADAGYLTRRLVENTQNFIIKERFCSGNDMISININMSPEGDLNLPLNLILWGKTLSKNIICKKRGTILMSKGTKLGTDIEKLLHKFNINQLYIAYSGLCISGRSICNYCYGFKNITSSSLGKSIGIIAGEAVGEPGTQMTLRSFHTGGVFKTNINSINTTSSQIFSKQIYSKVNLNSLFKIISIKKLNFKDKIKKNINNLNSQIYTKILGKILTKINPINIFSSLNYHILYKLLNNKIYLLIGKKNIDLYNTSKGYCLSYMPLYKTFISQLKHKKGKDTEEYLKTLSSGEILFKNALQLLVKNNNNWILYSLKNILAVQTKFLQKKIIKSGINIKTILNSPKNILKLFHLYPITYPFKQITNLKMNINKKNKNIYNILLSENKIKFYLKNFSGKKIYTYSLININGKLLNLKKITDQYSLMIAN